MAFDGWGVMPGVEEDEFVLAIQNPEPLEGHLMTRPFMRTFGPMSEDKIRAELKTIGASDAMADVAIIKAREEWKKRH